MDRAIFDHVHRHECSPGRGQTSGAGRIVFGHFTRMPKAIKVRTDLREITPRIAAFYVRSAVRYRIIEKNFPHFPLEGRLTRALGQAFAIWSRMHQKSIDAVPSIRRGPQNHALSEPNSHRNERELILDIIGQWPGLARLKTGTGCRALP